MTMDGCEFDHDLGEDSWYYAYSCCWSAPEPLGAKEELRSEAYGSSVGRAAPLKLSVISRP